DYEGVFTDTVPLEELASKQWDKSYGGNDVDLLERMRQTSDGGYILGGRSVGGINGDKSTNNFGSWDYWVIKVDAAGNKQWDRSFGGNGPDVLYDVQQTSDGGYILGGESASDVSGNKTNALFGGGGA